LDTDGVATKPVVAKARRIVKKAAVLVDPTAENTFEDLQDF
jgi:hypothetical protein